MFLNGRKKQYQPMLDDEEWMGTSQEWDSSEQIGEKGDKAEISPHSTAVAISTSETSAPHGDLSGNNGREMIAADDDSTLFMGLDFLVQFPFRKYRSCSSSALRSRRYTMLIALLLFVATLLLSIAMCVPVVTKSVVYSANSLESSSRLPRIGADWKKDAAENNDTDMSTVANEYPSITESDIHHTSNEENEVAVEEQTSMPEILNIEASLSTSSPIDDDIKNDMNDGINQDTGEENKNLLLTISTTATPSFTSYVETEDKSTGAPYEIAHNNIDQKLFKEPISITSTPVNIPSHTNYAEQDASNSNDVMFSTLSTVEAFSESNMGDKNLVEDEDSKAEPANNSIDGIISTYMSPNGPTDRESQWLQAHNTRRKQWHQANDVSFVPLKWSNGLVSSALAWAKVLADQEYEAFDLYHDDATDEGENLAMNCGSGSWDKIYHPDEILQRWVEEEVGLSPPDNLHLTQVLWRPTKYLGCAEAMRKYNNGKTCHVQVCRYSKMGNCNLGRYADWMIPMLLEDSLCGLECPPEGCI